MPLDILIITRNHPPLVGGMEKLVQHAVAALAEDYRCTVIGPRGCKRFISAPHRAIECDESTIPGFIRQAAVAALRVTRRQRVALVILGSGLPAPVGWLLQRRRRLPVLVFLHGLDIVARSLVYRHAWLPLLRHANFIVANSENTLRLARQHGITGGRHVVLHPGVTLQDIETTGPAPGFLQPHAGKPLLLSVGRLVRRKGLGPFIEHCMPQLLVSQPDLQLLVIGDEPGSALKKDSGLLAELQALVARLGLDDSVVFHGRGSDDDVQAAYRRADLFIFPLLEVAGDVEGFGMVAVEAAAQGTPTVAFRCGGVSDAVIDGETGWLVEPGDYTAFAKVTADAIRTGAAERLKGHCRAFAASKSWAHYGRSLREFVASAIDETSEAPPR